MTPKPEKTEPERLCGNCASYLDGRCRLFTTLCRQPCNTSETAKGCTNWTQAKIDRSCWKCRHIAGPDHAGYEMCVRWGDNNAARIPFPEEGCPGWEAKDERRENHDKTTD